MLHVSDDFFDACLSFRFSVGDWHIGRELVESLVDTQIAHVMLKLEMSMSRLDPSSMFWQD